MKKYFFMMLMTGIICLACILPKAQAADLSEAERNLAMAMFSMSSYSDELSLLTRQYLQDVGWQYQSDENINRTAEGRFHFVSRTLADGHRISVLAFPGTERKKDAEVDLRLHRVLFAGHNPQEFREFAANKEEKEAAKPLVHSGFNDYTQTAMFQKQIPVLHNMTAGAALAQELRAHPDETLYLTGHSLGGAVATLTAARLADMGVQPSQLQVITFGAPAVGNEAFARNYENKMQLTRITMAGDPVKSVLQSYSKGYVQFGNKVLWRQQTGLDRFEHEMVTYLDQAMRNYQDSRSTNEVSSLLSGQPQQVNGGILLAPIAVHLSDPMQGNAKYMEQSLQEVLRANYAPLHLAEKADSLSELQKQAVANGDSHICVLKVDGTRLKNENYNFQISLAEEIYDVQGNLQYMQVHATTTQKLTPLEAVLYLYYLGKDGEKEIF